MLLAEVVVSPENVLVGIISDTHGLLRAEAVEREDAAVLLLDARGRVDVAILVRESGGLANLLVYLTAPHAPDRLRKVAADLGLRIAEA